MINNVTLTGRLVRDPEMKYTPSGAAVTNFTIAVQRNFTNSEGEREADFISCVAWRSTAETIANYLSKGSLAGFVGSIQTRSYEHEEKGTVWVTEVVVERMTFLESKGEEEKPKGKPQKKPYNKKK
jgi:single-strand DNA-binding protein